MSSMFGGGGKQQGEEVMEGSAAVADRQAGRRMGVNSLQCSKRGRRDGGKERGWIENDKRGVGSWEYFFVQSGSIS